MNEQPRIDWNEYFLNIAKDVSKRATCLRRHYGAVLVNTEHQIVSTGYCGAPSGQQDCLTRGICWREENNIPSGSDYTRCLSVHAEMNALIQAGTAAKGCDLYVYGEQHGSGEIASGLPCILCAKLIVNAGIRHVITSDVPQSKVYLPDSILHLRNYGSPA